MGALADKESGDLKNGLIFLTVCAACPAIIAVFLQGRQSRTKLDATKRVA